MSVENSCVVSQTCVRFHSVPRACTSDAQPHFPSFTLSGFLPLFSLHLRFFLHLLLSTCEDAVCTAPRSRRAGNGRRHCFTALDRHSRHEVSSSTSLPFCSRLALPFSLFVSCLMISWLLSLARLLLSTLSYFFSCGESCEG